MILGALTLILGLVVGFHPTGSLNLVAVLLGVLIGSSPGSSTLIRVFGPLEIHQSGSASPTCMFIVVGVILIRHLHLTRAIIGLIIGITWIVQGLAAHRAAISSNVREGRAWWITLAGVISLIAGIVVAAAPASSLAFLAALLGIWFIVMGTFEIVGGLMLRRELRQELRVPGGARLTAHP